MNRIGNLPVDLYSATYDDNICIHIYCGSVYPQLPLVIGAPRGCCGHASGISFPVRYDLVGMPLTRLRTQCQGTLTAQYVKKNLNATVLQVTGTMQQSWRVLIYLRV